MAAPLKPWLACKADKGDIETVIHGITVRYHWEEYDHGDSWLSWLCLTAVKVGELWLAADESLAGDLFNKLSDDLEQAVREDAEAEADWWEAA